MFLFEFLVPNALMPSVLSMYVQVEAGLRAGRKLESLPLNAVSEFQHGMLKSLTTVPNASVGRLPKSGSI